MTTKTYYQLSLALPILVPLPFLTTLQHNTNPNPIALFLAESLWIGGIPYLLVAAYLLSCMQEKITEETRSLILRSPIMMPIAILVCGILELSLGRNTNGVGIFFVANSVGLFFIQWMVESIYAIVIGYAYVWIVNLVLWALKGLHLVQDQD